MREELGHAREVPGVASLPRDSRISLVRSILCLTKYTKFYVV